MHKRQKQVCPECNTALKASQNSCRCGWMKASAEARIDNRCAYHHAGVRCPLFGGLSDTTGKIIQVYCSGHFFYRNDPILGPKLLREALVQQGAFTKQDCKETSHDDRK